MVQSGVVVAAWKADTQGRSGIPWAERLASEGTSIVGVAPDLRHCLHCKSCRQSGDQLGSDFPLRVCCCPATSSSAVGGLIDARTRGGASCAAESLSLVRPIRTPSCGRLVGFVRPQNDLKGAPAPGTNEFPSLIARQKWPIAE